MYIYVYTHIHIHSHTHIFFCHFNHLVYKWVACSTFIYETALNSNSRTFYFPSYPVPWWQPLICVLAVQSPTRGLCAWLCVLWEGKLRGLLFLGLTCLCCCVSVLARVGALQWQLARGPLCPAHVPDITAQDGGSGAPTLVLRARQLPAALLWRQLCRRTPQPCHGTQRPAEQRAAQSTSVKTGQAMKSQGKDIYRSQLYRR